MCVCILPYMHCTVIEQRCDEKSSKEDWQSILLISAGPYTYTGMLQCQATGPPARLPMHIPESILGNGIKGHFNPKFYSEAFFSQR